MGTKAAAQTCCNTAHPVQIWRIEKVELAEVKPSSYGQFYGGDCYLVLYSYQMSSRQHYILYMWQVALPKPSHCWLSLPILIYSYM